MPNEYYRFDIAEVDAHSLADLSMYEMEDKEQHNAEQIGLAGEVVEEEVLFLPHLELQ